MFTRLLSLLIAAFWVVMTGLFLRDTYFPDHSRFASVPPRLVLDLFLADASAFNNTLHLYKDGIRTGHASFTARRPGDSATGSYAIVGNGTVVLHDQPLLEDGRRPEAAWRLRGELANAEVWRSLELDVRVPVLDLSAVLEWREGQDLPSVDVRRGGEVLMSTEMLRSMLAISGAAGLPALLGGMKSQPGAEKAPAITAREGVMDLAGKRRRCYILTAGLLGSEQVRAWFTESGALARMELPQGWQLIEPLMHGLSLDGG